MLIERITKAQAQETLRQISADYYESGRRDKMNLSIVHDFTGADIETADFYIVSGAFTYKRLKAEGLGDRLFIHSLGKSQRKSVRMTIEWGWQRGWLYIYDHVELLPCQFLTEAWRKADTEEARKSETQRFLVIDSPAIHFMTYGQTKPKPQEPRHPSLSERLKEYKRTKSERTLKAYTGTAQDIANAESLVKCLYEQIHENLATKQGTALLEYCVNVGRCDSSLTWIERSINTLKEFEKKGAGVFLNSWENLETMEQYKRILNSIDREALDIMRRAEA